MIKVIFQNVVKEPYQTQVVLKREMTCVPQPGNLVDLNGEFFEVTAVGWVLVQDLQDIAVVMLTKSEEVIYP